MCAGEECSLSACNLTAYVAIGAASTGYICKELNAPPVAWPWAEDRETVAEGTSDESEAGGSVSLVGGTLVTIALCFAVFALLAAVVSLKRKVIKRKWATLFAKVRIIEIKQQLTWIGGTNESITRAKLAG